MMNIDGLREILEKEEIIPTRLAGDIFDHPQDVDDLYKHHVRTYIPLHANLDESTGVTDFSKKFIRQVKEARAPRGYITADFGYGKTSTGLFIWDEAEKENLIAVPPFKLNRLEDMLDAIAGWVKYKFSKTVPALVDDVLEIYRFYHDRELQNISERYGVTYDQAKSMFEDETLVLSITPKDIVRFFAQMTDLTIKAGFEGLIVIPDELQQYLEPEIKSGKVDPLVPLFDIVTNILDFQGKLKFGLLMIITSKELGVINDQRGDLIDRLRGNTLDLRTIYDRQFAAKLWKCFAKAFNFEHVSSKIIDAFTLESLGQIASRQDLSNGPRTVVNVFRKIAQRTLDSDGYFQAYTPIDLIEDFINNNIVFDARKFLQEATNKALANNFVRGTSTVERAVKLIAAFPVDGATREIQTFYELAGECSRLRSNLSPEIVIEIGDINHPSLTLRELDQAQENADELTLILREFIRNYEPLAANQIERSVNSFINLLKLVFKPENWSYLRIDQRKFSQNAEMGLIGAFPEMQRRFPDRTIHIRILGDDENIIVSNLNGDCHLTFVLHSHFGFDGNKEQAFLGGIQIDEVNNLANYDLNLLLPCFDVLNRSLQEQLRRVVDIDQVNVLLVLSLYHFLQNAVDREGVSKTLKEMIQRSMTVRLLEGALQVLLNPSIDTNHGYAGGRIIEKTVTSLIETRYGQNYHTLITYKQWRDSLRNYLAALNQLTSFAQKQGFILVEGTKDEIARYFSTTAASFDAFHSRISLFIKIEGGTFPGRSEIKKGQKSGVYFTRHPLEDVILHSLGGKKKPENIQVKTSEPIRLEIIHNDAQSLGYREEEIDFILDIMQARELIEINNGWVNEKKHPEISKTRLIEKIREFKLQAELLYQSNKQKDSEQMVQRAEYYTNHIQGLNELVNEIEIVLLTEQVRSDSELLQTLIEREITHQKDRLFGLKLESLSSECVFQSIQSNGFGTFITSINQISLQKREIFDKWKADVSNYQNIFNELADCSSNDSIQLIKQFRTEIDNLEDQYRLLIDRKTSLEFYARNLKVWDEVSSKLPIIGHVVQRFGHLADPIITRYKEIEQKISSDFQNNPYDAFNHAESYHVEISSIEHDIEEYSVNLELKFDQIQETYRQLFMQRVGSDHIKLWQKIYYSQNNPESVFEYLLGIVENQVSDLLDTLSNGVEQTQNIIIGFKIANSDQKENCNKQLSLMENQIRGLNDEFTHLSEEVDRECIRDINKFDVWLSRFGQAHMKLINYREEVTKLGELLQQHTSTIDGKTNLDSNIFSNNFSNLHFIREELKNLTDEEFWQLIRNSWEHGKIEVQLRKYDVEQN